MLFVDMNGGISRMLQGSGDPSLELHRLWGGVTLRRCLAPRRFR